jgi:hypothetical protein
MILLLKNNLAYALVQSDEAEEGKKIMEECNKKGVSKSKDECASLIT